jgi:predicted small secreted protein
MKTSPLIISLFIATSLVACSNTMTGIGKDLQEVGKKMDPQAKPVETAPNSSSGTPSTKPNKDVTITPVK